jgi:hypothetical protein
MKKVGIGVMCLLLVSFLCTTVYAQEEIVGPEAGDLSISPLVSYSVLSMDVAGAEDIEQLMIQTTLAYYITRMISLGASLTTTGSGENIDDNMAVGLMLEPRLHFSFSRASRMVPYVGAGAGFQYSARKYNNDTEEDTVLAYAIFGGLDYFFTEDTSLRTSIRNDFYTVEDGGGGEDIKFDIMTFLIGLNFIF